MSTIAVLTRVGWVAIGLWLGLLAGLFFSSSLGTWQPSVVDSISAGSLMAAAGSAQEGLERLLFLKPKATLPAGSYAELPSSATETLSEGGEGPSDGASADLQVASGGGGSSSERTGADPEEVGSLAGDEGSTDKEGGESLEADEDKLPKPKAKSKTSNTLKTDTKNPTPPLDPQEKKLQEEALINSVIIVKKFPELTKIKAAESPECAVPRPPQACRLAANQRIHIIFVSATWQLGGGGMEKQTKNVIKSILAQTKCKLWVHYLVFGPPETEVIPSFMESLGGAVMVPEGWTPRPISTRPLKGFMNLSVPATPALLYSLYEIPSEWVIERAAAMGLFPFRHHAGLAGMAKFFMADILWQVDKALFVDLDMVFGGDIQDLWDHFKAMKRNPKLLYWLGDNHPESPHRIARWHPFCSGQMVLHLERMRRANITEMLLKALNGTKPRKHTEYRESGDQWLFNWVCLNYSYACKILSSMWNISGCSWGYPFLGLNGRGREANGSCWRIVHFNCGKKLGRPESLEDWQEVIAWVDSLTEQQLKQMVAERA